MKARKISPIPVGDGQTIIQALRSYKRLATVHQISDLLGISEKALYAKAKAGIIPSANLVGPIRFDPKRVSDWLEAHAD